MYADTVAIAISRGINQRARKREERGGSIAPSRDHREIYSRRGANSLSASFNSGLTLVEDARTDIGSRYRPNLISRHSSKATKLIYSPPRNREPRARTCRGHVRIAGSAQRVAVGNGVQRSAGDKNFSLFDYRNFRSRLRGNGDSTSKGF